MRNLLALVLVAITTCAAADLKVKLAVEKPSLPELGKCPGIRCVSVPDEPGIHEETIYVHGSSQRVEFQGVAHGQAGAPFSDEPFTPELIGSFRLIMPHMAVITHCDTGQVIELDLDSREYREFKQPKYPSEKAFAKDVERMRKGAEKRVRWKTVDTGEKKEFFGLSARHQITTIREKLFITEVEEVVDGWYMDLAQPGCAPEYLRQGDAEMFTFDGSATDVMTSCNCLDFSGNWGGYRAYSTMFWAEGNFIPIGLREVTLADSPYSTITDIDGRPLILSKNFYNSWLYVGFTPRGLAVEQTISGKSWTPGYGHEAARPKERKPLKTSIVELSTAPVDPALFEIPTGFVKVKKLYQHRSILERVSK